MCRGRIVLVCTLLVSTSKIVIGNCVRKGSLTQHYYEHDSLLCVVALGFCEFCFKVIMGNRSKQELIVLTLSSKPKSPV